MGGSKHPQIHNGHELTLIANRIGFLDGWQAAHEEAVDRWMFAQTGKRERGRHG